MVAVRRSRGDDVHLMRFDLRAPGRDNSERAALYRNAIDMSAWADEQGGLGSVVVSEHHCTDDGYIPSPFLLASAVAAVTRSTPIVVAAAILPFYDPVRLAEDIIALDHLSEGRSLVVLGLGYRREEYELFGVDYDRRGAVADKKLERLLELLHDAGRSGSGTSVTPAPFSDPVPMVAWGGRTRAAARRAGRNGIGLFAQHDAPGMREAYVEAARSNGHEPGLCVLPSPDTPFIVFVDDDVDHGWDEVGRSLLVDARGYLDWNDHAGMDHGSASLTAATTVDGLRASGGSHRVVTSDEAVELIRQHGLLGLHPLCGGLDPEVAWPYLRRAVAASHRAHGIRTADRARRDEAAEQT